MATKDVVISLESWTHNGLVQLARALYAEGMNSESKTQRMICSNHLVEVIKEVELRNGRQYEELGAMQRQLST